MSEQWCLWWDYYGHLINRKCISTTSRQMRRLFIMVCIIEKSPNASTSHSFPVEFPLCGATTSLSQSSIEEFCWSYTLSTHTNISEILFLHFPNGLGLLTSMRFNLVWPFACASESWFVFLLKTSWKLFALGRSFEYTTRPWFILLRSMEHQKLRQLMTIVRVADVLCRPEMPSSPKR